MCFKFHQRISQRGVRTSLEEQLDPKGPIAPRGGLGPIAPRGGSVPVFLRLRKPIAISDFPGPLSPSGSAHDRCQTDLSLY